MGRSAGAFAIHPFVQLIPALLDHPLSELSQHVHFMPGIPVRPMLAKPTTGVSEVLDKFSGTEFTCEYKYDGERVQVGTTLNSSHHGRGFVGACAAGVVRQPELPVETCLPL